MSDDRSVVGFSLPGGERPSKRFRTGRECREEECKVRLSVYNPGEYCALHQPMIVPRTRGRKIA